MSGQATINVVDDEDMSSQEASTLPWLRSSHRCNKDPRRCNQQKWWHPGPMVPDNDTAVGGSGTERPSGSYRPSAVYIGGSCPHCAGPMHHRVRRPNRLLTKSRRCCVRCHQNTPRYAQKCRDWLGEMAALRQASGRRCRNNGPSTSDSAADIIRVEFARGAYGIH